MLVKNESEGTPTYAGDPTLGVSRYHNGVGIRETSTDSFEFLSDIRINFLEGEHYTFRRQYLGNA